MSADEAIHDCLQHAAAQPVPVIGEGCAQRYDPQALSEQHGVDFSAAVLLRAQYCVPSSAEERLDHKSHRVHSA